VAWAADMVAVPLLAAGVALAVGLARPAWLARLPVLVGLEPQPAAASATSATTASMVRDLFMARLPVPTLVYCKVMRARDAGARGEGQPSGGRSANLWAFVTTFYGTGHV
jgi:hypothetical protein